MQMTSEHVPGSFRDPSGFVFALQGTIYRQINQSYKQDYDRLMDSGLYDHLAKGGLLIPHQEVTGVESPSPDDVYKTIEPEKVAFISYPYEWCFSQIKDAALATLAIQKAALQFGMTLKDCSAYNIQFHKGKPVFIDTLSFEQYEEGMPWTPYRQFCQHFLAPLALMSHTDISLSKLYRVFIDGIPLDLAVSALPYRTRFKVPLLLHIHMHAKSQRRYSDKPIERTRFKHKMSRTALLALLDSLEGGVRKLNWKPGGTEWADYYSDDSYVDAAFDDKRRIVSEYIAQIAPKTLWDMGANTGSHSRLASENGVDTVAFDIDPAAVELNYLQVRKSGEQNILPLLLDLTNPSPSIGWQNDERESILQRGPADASMALALIHHLAISNNVPLGLVAEFFSKICSFLIIEFVPKSDHKVKILLATREDVFPDYTQEGFEAAFGELFEIVRSDRIADSGRMLYLMKRR